MIPLEMPDMPYMYDSGQAIPTDHGYLDYAFNLLDLLPGAARKGIGWATGVTPNEYSDNMLGGGYHNAYLGYVPGWKDLITANTPDMGSWWNDPYGFDVTDFLGAGIDLAIPTGYGMMYNKLKPNSWRSTSDIVDDAKRSMLQGYYPMVGGR